MFAKNVEGKFKGMRKPQSFTLYPARYDNGTTIQIQSDKSIGRINPETGEGVLYVGKGEHPGGALLAAFGESFQFPPDFTAAVKEAHAAKYGAEGTAGPVRIL